MTFRPYPLLSVFTALSFVVLVWLGFWQAGRAGWKADLIAEAEKQATSPARRLEDWYCGATSDARVLDGPAIDGATIQLTDAPPFRMYGVDPKRGAGWRLLSLAKTPTCLDGGKAQAAQAILVESGFAPAFSAGAAEQPAAAAPTRLTPRAWPARGSFAADNSSATNEWHWFDAEAMQRASSVAFDTSIYLAADTGLAESLTQTPPSRHIGYSVTWFGMAAALVVVYAAFHMQAGRLRWRN